jgi:hypothetical protein
METKTVQIRVNSEVARMFETASEERRRQLEALISLKLSDLVRNRGTLEEVMSDVSQKAQARGLTPAILESLLGED